MAEARVPAGARAEIPVEVFPGRARGFPVKDPAPVVEKGAGGRMLGVLPAVTV